MLWQSCDQSSDSLTLSCLRPLSHTHSVAQSPGGLSWPSLVLPFNNVPVCLIRSKNTDGLQLNQNTPRIRSFSGCLHQSVAYDSRNTWAHTRPTIYAFSRGVTSFCDETSPICCRPLRPFPTFFFWCWVNWAFNLTFQARGTAAYQVSTSLCFHTSGPPSAESRVCGAVVSRAAELRVFRGINDPHMNSQPLWLVF